MVAADAQVAEDHQGLAGHLAQLVDARRKLVERHVERAGDGCHAQLLRVSYVDDDRTLDLGALERPGQLARAHLTHGHRAPRSRGARPTG